MTFAMYWSPPTVGKRSKRHQVICIEYQFVVDLFVLTVNWQLHIRMRARPKRYTLVGCQTGVRQVPPPHANTIRKGNLVPTRSSRNPHLHAQTTPGLSHPLQNPLVKISKPLTNWDSRSSPKTSRPYLVRVFLRRSSCVRGRRFEGRLFVDRLTTH
jgi:hypothetical protein